MLFGGTGTALVYAIILLIYGSIVFSAQLSITSDNRRPTSLYRAPSNYRSSFKKDNSYSVPAPFIITSRPLMFTNNNDHASGASTVTGHSIKHKTKVSLFSYVPGMATIFCKGLSCNHNSNIANSNSDDDDSGFPGEAIPIEPSDQFMTVNVGGNVKTTRPIFVTNGVVEPILLPKPSTIFNDVPNRPGPSPTRVNLMTNRPYIQRGPPKTTRRTTTAATTTKPSHFFRQSTTRRRTRRTTSSTTSRPLVASDSVASPTTNVGGGFKRPPSLFIPAITAFTLMALPVAAAAVPFIIQSGKRRRRAAPTALSNFKESLEINQELISILDDLHQLSQDESVIHKKVNKHIQNSMYKIFNAAGNVNKRLSTRSLQENVE